MLGERDNACPFWNEEGTWMWKPSWLVARESGLSLLDDPLNVNTSAWVYGSPVGRIGEWTKVPVLIVCVLFADWDSSSTELECGNAIWAFLQTPAPVLDKISGPMGARFLSSTGPGVWQPHRTSTIPLSIRTGSKSVSQLSLEIGRSERLFVGQLSQLRSSMWVRPGPDREHQ